MAASPSDLPGSDEVYRIDPASFVVPAGVTSCMVDSTIQMQPAAAAPSGTVYFRNAVSRNGANADDGAYGQYLYNDGTGKKQAPMSRSSLLTVTPGETVAFGVYLGSLSSGWYYTSYAAMTSYICS